MCFLLAAACSSESDARFGGSEAATEGPVGETTDIGGGDELTTTDGGGFSIECSGSECAGFIGSGATASCGDGVLAASEACDDGNTDAGDGCSGQCVLEAGFNCFVPGSACVACGDGLRDPLEGCDDGNLSAGDGCSASCTLEAGARCELPGQPCTLCGDGVAEGLEQCDDANLDDADGCSASCEVETGWDCSFDTCVAAGCSDGLLAGSEACDDGNALSGDGCSFRCEVEAGYVCVSPGVPCRLAVCGDSAVEAQEQCDDGNTTAADGCSATCQLETGFACETPGAPCTSTSCGDGVVEGLEQCDDGDTDSADGCSASCQLEAGFHCPTAGADCEATSCGDGVAQGLEACDDGNTDNDDGCSASCEEEAFYSCDPQTTSCEVVAEYVRVAVFPAPMAQPQAVLYDPRTRSFTAYGFNASQGSQEVCLDGTLRGSRTRYGVGNSLDGATYDPFRDRFLFIQQNGTLTEVDAATGSVVGTRSLSGVGTAGGIAVGDDGRLYVSNHFEKAIKVFDFAGTSPIETIPAPTDGPYLDNLFALAGEGLVGYYNMPPGGSTRQFAFHQLDGTLEGRSDIPGTLFATGQDFPRRADGGEAAPDGGAFLVCSEYLSDGGGTGICQLFSRRCSTDSECAARIPGTACKQDEPIPFCFAPALARDDTFSLPINSVDAPLEVLRNDTVSAEVCKGNAVRVTAVTSSVIGATVSINGAEDGLLYSAPADACGVLDNLQYTVDLGGQSLDAEVSVFIACICGDGVQQSGEACDDNNTANGDGCSASCQIEPECGNGTVEPGEACDDGNLIAGDGCSPTCTSESGGGLI